MAITHNKVATLPDEAGAEVNKAEWNDAHAVSLTKAEFDTACSDGNFVFISGDAGTPSALVGTNLTGTASGLTAGTVTTNANLTGDVTSVGNATTLTNAPVIAKVLTGYVSGAGTVAATDSILAAIQKLNGNDATNANLTGHITSVGNAAVLGSFTIAQLSTAISDANISGTNTGDQTITLTGNVTGTGTGSFATTIAAGVVTEAMQVLADNVTQDVSITKHGYAPKAPNDATKYLSGTGAYATPASNTALVYANTTVPAGNTVANTVTETAFTSTYTIAANTLVAGQVIRVKAFGVYGTDVVAPTLQGRVRFGGIAGTVLLDTGSITAIAAVTNGGWSFDALFVVQAIGATGTMESQGYAEFATAATTALSVNAENTAAITVDTTASAALAVTIQWGTANAANTITMREITVSIETPAANAGVLGIPINSKSVAYTTVLADANTCIYHPAADTTARTWTIDSNANVAYPIGTALTFDNDIGAGALTIAITTDTLVLISAGTTGSRTLGSGGQATALKVTATRWRISGVGLT